MALGFPDIYFQPADAFSTMVTKFDTSKSDVLLSLFPVSDPYLWDVVVIDQSDKVVDIRFRGDRVTGKAYTWIMSLWNPRFTKFMDHFLSEADPEKIEQDELMLDHVILAAIDKGFNVQAVPFENGIFLDIGT